MEDKLPPGIIRMKDANSIDNQLKILKKLKFFYFTAQDQVSEILNKKYDNFTKIRFYDYKSFNFFIFN